MVTKISDKVLEKIKEENIKPIPRWKFVLKNTAIWLFLIILLLLGATMTSLAIGDFIDGDWDIRPMLGLHLITFIFMTFPFIWVILGLVMIFLAYYDFKYLPKSYKVGSQKYLMIVLALVLSLGLGLYYIGGHNPIKKIINKNIPPLREWEQQRDMRWVNPNSGLLAGTIKEVDGKNLVLTDMLLNQEWQIDASQATVSPSVSLVPQEKVKMIGKMENDNKFVAKDIRPWKKGFDEMMPPPPPSH